MAAHRPLRKLGNRLLALEAETAARCLVELEHRSGVAADALARVASHAHETLDNPPRFARRPAALRAALALRRRLARLLATLWPARHTAAEDAIAAIAAMRGGIETVLLIDLIADSAGDPGLRRWCATWLERRRGAAFVSEAELRAGITRGSLERPPPRLEPTALVAPRPALADRLGTGHPSAG